MTTRIKVTNQGPSNITVTAINPERQIGEEQLDGEVLPPGAAVEKYVWRDTAILITED